jgi:hypothetical protein
MKGEDAMKPGWLYDALRGVAALLTLGGALCLVAHLAGQISKGRASDLTLVGGLACLLVGVLFLVLADLGARLVRIETKLGTLPQGLPGFGASRAGETEFGTPGSPMLHNPSAERTAAAVIFPEADQSPRVT